MLREQLSKRSGIYSFSVTGIETATPRQAVPLLSASVINSMRRLTASDLDALPCGTRPLAGGHRPEAFPAPAEAREGELMRSRYCIRYELGLCPRFQNVGAAKRLYLLNNGRKFALNFDCAACEMTLSEAQM